KDSAKWEKFRDRFAYDERHRMFSTGVTRTYLFKGNKTYLKSIASFSNERNTTDEDTLNYQYQFVPIYNDTFNYNDLRFSVMLNHKANSRNLFRFGLIETVKFHNLSIFDLNRETGKYDIFLEENGNTQLHQAYLQWQYKPGVRVTINSGVHGWQFALNNDYSVEPRVGLRWQLNNLQALSIGGGLHSRVETVSNYLYRIYREDSTQYQPNLSVKCTKAAHIVAGYDLQLSEYMRLKAELYYQHLYDIPVQDSTSFAAVNYVGGLADFELVNNGTGRNYGVELTLERFLNKGYYYLFTTSLFESKYTGGDKIERNTFFNNRYVFNALGGKEFKVGREKNNSLSFNGRIIWKGGNMVTPIDLEKSKEHGREVLVEGAEFTEQSPDYIRLDIGISYRKNNQKWAWILSADAQNVTNRLNIYSSYYDNSTRRIEHNYNLGIVPILRFQVEF
ncbi:MAG: TonB-dependent receptor, partial [Bacteroidetes bacterium]|nr:TonB-dependent receptor [Bacteroidota bacterium]